MRAASYMAGMNVTQFDESKVNRDSLKRFDFKAHTKPDIDPLGGAQPVIINSPVTGERRANLWIVIPDGQAVEMNVFEAGIGRPEEETWREDTITFRRTDEGVRAVYEVIDDDISALFGEAAAELDEAEFDAMIMELRNEVRDRSRGNTDVFFQDGHIQFRHVSDHDVNEDGGFFTANVFGTLESDQTYVLTRDGVLFPAAYRVLSEYGFGDEPTYHQQ